MKRIQFLWLVALNISASILYGQPNNVPSCIVLNNPSTSNFALTPLTHCFDFDANFANAPIMNIYINAHITISEQSETPQMLVQTVRNFIDEANRVLDNLQPNFGIPTTRTPWIPRAKIRFKLFSDIATQPNDQFGGIWVYPFRQGLGTTITIIDGVENLTLDEPPTAWPHQNRYGSNVLDVVFANYRYTNPAHALSTGRAFLNGTNANNAIWVADLNRQFFRSNQPGANNEALLQLSKAFNHEVGHILSLLHAEDCDNNCSTVRVNPLHDSDINTGSECGSRCPNESTCEFENPGTVTCGDGNRNCLWSNSALMMAQGWLQHSITPCQWNRMFNYVRPNTINYLRLCHTANTFTLPTSPLREYRASQQITSTSPIAAGRNVDYFSPSIILNPNFTVALGAQFLAYPAFFTCCGEVGIGGGQLAEDNNQINVLTPKFNFIPNPFGDYIQINYQIDTDFDKVDLTMTDISGKIVKNIPINAQSKGQYQIEIKTNDLSNGIYFIQYQSNGNISTQKIVKTNRN